MPQAQRKYWHRAPITVAVLTLCGCSDGESVQPLSYARAVELSREAAAKYGYDLSEYAVDTVRDPKAGGEAEWLILYKCRPDPAPPGCHFMVVVDRKTGSTKVLPGA
jgi:hypothetical protein